MRRVLGLLIMACSLTACSGNGSAPTTNSSATDDSSVVDSPPLNPASPQYLDGSSRPSAAPTTQWLHTSGNHIYTADGNVWVGRGMNMHDTRSCDACTARAPNIDEVKRRIDIMVDQWHATFLRLMLESYASPDYTNGTGQRRVQWASILQDTQYLDSIRQIVDYIGTKPNVYVMITLWVDPSENGGPNTATDKNSYGWPTAQTAQELALLVQAFQGSPQVIFAAGDEPSEYVNANDPYCWTAMNAMVQAVRDSEDKLGARHHLVAVQGTQGWGRLVSYYTNHPMTAGNGENVVYETHPYTVPSNFQSNFLDTAAVLPVIIGEFAPESDSQGNVYMSTSDAQALMDTAQQHQIPWAAWTFHPQCGPNALLQLTSAGACPVGTPLSPSAWGSVVLDRLLTP